MRLARRSNLKRILYLHHVVRPHATSPTAPPAKKTVAKTAAAAVAVAAKK